MGSSHSKQARPRAPRASKPSKRVPKQNYNASPAAAQPYRQRNPQVYNQQFRPEDLKHKKPKVDRKMYPQIKQIQAPIVPNCWSAMDGQAIRMPMLGLAPITGPRPKCGLCRGVIDPARDNFVLHISDKCRAVYHDRCMNRYLSGLTNNRGLMMKPLCPTHRCGAPLNIKLAQRHRGNPLGYEPFNGRADRSYRQPGLKLKYW